MDNSKLSLIELKQIKIGNYLIGDKNSIFVMAEAGINHNGSFKLAKKMIDSAKMTGADCIKFQTHITDKEMIKSNIKPGNISKKTLWNIIKNSELSEKEEAKIQQYCKKKKILFLSTPFSVEAVDRLEKINVPAYKIGSGELTNFPLLKRIADTKKPVILSSGMSELKEIKESVSFFKKRHIPIILLQTTSIYPSDYKDVNLGVIEKFQKLFNIPIGLSDHSPGIYTALGAVAKGACLIEKHFTLNKNLPGPDQKLSLEPNEFSELVKGCRAVKLALGNSKKILSKEKPILKFARESVVSLKNIPTGEKFSEKNITTKRPATGDIPSRDYYKIIGKLAKRNIPKNVQLSKKDIC
ncbi:MAG: N-acetylneuraminate synthase family protein [Nitrosopumilus sp.]|uniref:N-acetylneuraminate synthase family protein n=1 Tax=Nitrosopumilus sp. TaxID=2024843 RepID=UPI0024322E30|nr:N-acetylneuraminate synthase family protein [Nitrosopumilus sp.]MCV0366619.1 N-acetylneuraminate synthase family protein [Nitrosopumilus sp.]